MQGYWERIFSVKGELTVQESVYFHPCLILRHLVLFKYLNFNLYTHFEMYLVASVNADAQQRNLRFHTPLMHLDIHS